MTSYQQRSLEQHNLWLRHRDEHFSIKPDQNERLYEARLGHFRIVAFIQGGIGQQVLAQLTQFPLDRLVIVPITAADLNMVERLRDKLSSRARQFIVHSDIGHIHQLPLQLANTDLAIMAVSRPFPEFAAELNKALICTETHGLFAHLQGINISLGPLVFPGYTACYACYLQRLHINTDYPDVEIALDQYFRSDFNFDWEGQHSTINLMAAGLVVAEVLRFATGYYPPATLGSELMTSLLTEAPYSHNFINPVSSCPVCGNLRRKLTLAAEPPYTLRGVIEKYRDQ